jgi:hypothetical protein
MRRSVAALGVALLAVMAANLVVAQTAARVFALRHRTPQEAATFVASMLSTAGTVLIQPGANSITVRDDPAVIGRVSAALRAWDAPPLSYNVRVQIFLAHVGEIAKGREPARLPGLDLDLFKLFRFSSYEPLDDVRLVAADGSSVETNISNSYTLRFAVSAPSQAPDRLQLKPLELFRRAQTPSGLQEPTLVLRTVVSLAVGQVGIVAAAQSEQAGRVLLLVMTATRTDGQTR